jgi:hypothetical protein
MSRQDPVPFGELKISRLRRRRGPTAASAATAIARTTESVDYKLIIRIAIITTAILLAFEMLRQ